MTSRRSDSQLSSTSIRGLSRAAETCSSLASPAWQRSLSVMSSPCSVTLEHGCDHGAAQFHRIHLVLAGLYELGKTRNTAGVFRAGDCQRTKLVLAVQSH